MSLLNTFLIIVNIVPETTVFWCKIMLYMEYFLPSASAWILVYVSFMRYFTIRSLNKIQLLERDSFNMAVNVVITMVNVLVYAPVAVYDGLLIAPSTNQSNVTVSC